MQRVRDGLLRKRKSLRNVGHAAALLVGRADRVTLQRDQLGPCGKTALAHRYRAHRVPRQTEIPSNVRERLAVPRPRNDLPARRTTSGIFLGCMWNLPCFHVCSGIRERYGVTAATCKGCLWACLSGARQLTAAWTCSGAVLAHVLLICEQVQVHHWIIQYPSCPRAPWARRLEDRRWPAYTQDVAAGPGSNQRSVHPGCNSDARAVNR